MIRRIAQAMLIAVAASALTARLATAADATGTISGIVTNKTTGNGLIGAKIEIPAARLTALVDNTGRYLLNVPAGTHELVVTYTGLDTQNATLSVTGGQNIVRNFEMSSSVYMLDAFKVASVKEGLSSAMTQQRNANNLVNIASMDALADLPNMNATELAIRLPGVTFADPGDEVVETISVRGMGGNMTSITIDGGGMSSFAAPGRTTRMTSFTGNMFESLELTKGQTPDRAVDSLGGGVNFKTRSPLSMKEKRRITYSLTGRVAPWFTEQVPMREARRAHELMNFFYQEKFAILGAEAGSENLAVSVNAFKSENAFGFFNSSRDFQQTNTQPAYLWDYRTRDDYNNRKQFSVSSKWDYRFNRNNLFKLNLVFNDQGEPMRKRPLMRAFAGGTTTVPNNFTNTTFVAGQAVPSGVVPGWTDRITVVRAVPSAATAANPTSATGVPAQIDESIDAVNREQRLRHLDLAGEHTWGPIEADWALLHSRTRYRYLGSEGQLNMSIGRIPFVGPNGGPGSLTNNITGPGGVTGVGWILDRTQSDLYPRFIQNGGLDWTNPANWRPRITDGLNTASGALDVDLIRELRANFRYKLPVDSFTAYLKTGASLRDHNVEQYRPNRRWNYIGTGPLPVDPTVLMWDTVKTGRRIPVWEATMFIREGQPIDPSLWQEDKYYYEQNRLTNSWRVNELITGYYAMTQGRIGHTGFLGGLRHEKTDTTGYSRVRSRVLSTAAQQAADPSGSGIRDYNNPVVREGIYGQNFPSIHLWHDITPNLKARGSWTTGFGRPAMTNAVTALGINETAQTITFSNPGLKPTKARNWDFSLEYYFEPSSSLTVGWFHKTIDDYIIGGQQVGVVASGPDNDFNGDYSGFAILSNSNAGRAITQGWEISYLQQFRFLPGLLKTLRFQANLTELRAHGDYGTAGVYLTGKQVNGFIPRTVNANLSWDYRKFSTNISYNYNSESIRGAFNIAQPSRNRYMMSREIVNASVRYQLPWRNVTLSMGVYNLFNAPQIYYRSIPDQLETFLMQGTTMTFGLEGRF
ncbi:MAG: TonB-dependent receptor [Verrucomicrobia bacterium]|nr:TonB-dependent receptor [Verrucomicrobiota bacterium]